MRSENITQNGAVNNTTNMKLRRIQLEGQAVGQILSRSASKRDTVQISAEGQKYSREYLTALVDKSANMTEAELSFYFENYNNPKTLLDTLNFGTEIVEGGWREGFSDFGYVTVGNCGQILPNYAVPRMNASSLDKMQAVDNKLILSNESYYSYTTKNGKSYAWSVKNGRTGWAASEKHLATVYEESGKKDGWEMVKAGNILSSLAQGKGGGSFQKDIVSVLNSVGIQEGPFQIDAGAGTHHYILEGKIIINADERVEFYGNTNWLNYGYKENDVFQIYGKEYAIDSEGHIDISAEDDFTCGEIVYPERNASDIRFPPYR